MPKLEDYKILNNKNLIEKYPYETTQLESISTIKQFKLDVPSLFCGGNVKYIAKVKDCYYYLLVTEAFKTFSLMIANEDIDKQNELTRKLEKIALAEEEAKQSERVTTRKRLARV